MKAREVPVLFAIFLDMIGFGIAFPDLQIRAEQYGASGIGIGLLLSSYFAVQLVVSPWWGKLSDRVGRKPILLICTALSSVSMIAYAFLPNVWGILASRLLAGFAAANVVVGQAYLADITPESERGGAMGRMSAALLLGLVGGPAMGGFLGKYGGNYGLGLVAASMSALACVWIALGVKHVPPAEAREPGRKRFAFNFGILFDLPALARVMVFAMAGYFVLACLEGTFGRLIERTLGYDQRHFGIIFSYESLLGAGMGLIFGRLSKVLSYTSLLKIGYLTQGIGVALTPHAPNFPMLVIASTLWGFGLGLITPTINTVATELTPSDRQGEVFGVLQATRSAGFLVGPALGGWLFDIRPALVYYVAAGVAILAGIVIWVPGRKSAPPDEIRGT